jgi:hypothetical protein
MASRRSTRLQNQVALERTEDRQPPPVEVVERKRLKTAASKPAPKQIIDKNGTNKTAKSTSHKGKELQTPPQLSSASDRLSSLPPEVLDMALKNVSLREY